MPESLLVIYLGPPGPKGDPGPAGGTGTAILVDVPFPDTVHLITHTFGGFPNVSAIDSTNREVDLMTDWIDTTHLQVTSNQPFSGKLILS